MKNNIKGFTLAEVLITLSILGVVAAISIPNILHNYQKRVAITKVQKAYANLEVMATNLAVNTGCLTRDIRCVYDVLGRDGLEHQKSIPAEKVKTLATYAGFNKTKTLSNNLILYQVYCLKQNCGPSPRSDGRSYASKNSVLAVDNSNYSYSFSYNNGFVRDVNNVPQADESIVVYVFTDGIDKSKAILGKNLFSFIIYSNFTVEPMKYCFGKGMCPASYNGQRATLSIDDNCDSSVVSAQSGYTCAARIMKDGWKINYW